MQENRNLSVTSMMHATAQLKQAAEAAKHELKKQNVRARGALARACRRRLVSLRLSDGWLVVPLVGLCALGGARPSAENARRASRLPPHDIEREDAGDAGQ